MNSIINFIDFGFMIPVVNKINAYSDNSAYLKTEDNIVYSKIEQTKQCIDALQSQLYQKKKEEGIVDSSIVNELNQAVGGFLKYKAESQDTNYKNLNNKNKNSDIFSSFQNTINKAFDYQSYLNQNFKKEFIYSFNSKNILVTNNTELINNGLIVNFYC